MYVYVSILLGLNNNSAFMGHCYLKTSYSYLKIYIYVKVFKSIPTTTAQPLLNHVKRWMISNFIPVVSAFLLGSIIAAVSPAVIVPCLFRLRGKGYGVSKGIPTLVLAVSGVDDAASVAIFGIVSSLMFSGSSVLYNIIQVDFHPPLSIEV